MEANKYLIATNCSDYNTQNLKIYSDYIPLQDSFLQDSFLFVVHKEEAFNCIYGELNSYIEKEKLYIQAIENLLKQRAYLNLAYQAGHHMISDEEFHEELEKNENKYLIKVDKNIDYEQLKILSKIIRKINYAFSDDDFAEIFSIDFSNISSFMNNHIIAEQADEVSF